MYQEHSTGQRGSWPFLGALGHQCTTIPLASNPHLPYISPINIHPFPVSKEKSVPPVGRVIVKIPLAPVVADFMCQPGWVMVSRCLVKQKRQVPRRRSLLPQAVASTWMSIWTITACACVFM